MTVATLTVNDREKANLQMEDSNYKNLPTVVLEQLNFIVRKAKWKTKFGNTFKTWSCERVFSLIWLCGCSIK